MIAERLSLWMLTDPAQPVLVGTLNEQTNGDVSLRYSANWIAAGLALSPDMPLAVNEYRPGEYRPGAAQPSGQTGVRDRRGRREPCAPGAVDDARPDHWGEKVIRALHKPRHNRLIEFLYYAGDNRFGALGVSLSDSGYQPLASVIPALGDAQTLSDIAKAIEAGEEISAQRRQLAQAGGSLGGAKAKAAIAVNGVPCILKLFNGEHVDQPLVEHATTLLARTAGIDAVETSLIPLAGEHAIAVKRFDRHGALRMHCVSASTLLKAEDPGQPMFGYPHLARALRRHAPQKIMRQQLHELFRRMVFNILIANTDDHEKNHSLIAVGAGAVGAGAAGAGAAGLGAGRGYVLAPAYDLVPTGSGAMEHQFLTSEDSHAARLDLALGVCAQFDHTEQSAFDEINRVIAVVAQWKEHFRQDGVSDADISELESVIDQDALLQQRTEFAQTKIKGPQRKRPRANPFAGPAGH